MVTRNVVLTDHVDPVIDGLVDAGRYQNTSKVMTEGLRRSEQLEAQALAKLAALRSSISAGLIDLQQGRCDEIDGDQLGSLLAEIGERVSISPSKKR